MQKRKEIHNEGKRRKINNNEKQGKSKIMEKEREIENNWKK